MFGDTCMSRAASLTPIPFNSSTSDRSSLSELGSSGRFLRAARRATRRSAMTVSWKSTAICDNSLS
ncbi:hypothetical protein D3C83_129220 [compost metagenome]